MNENLTNFQLSKLYHRWDALSILFLKNPEKIFENQRTKTIKDENQSETSFTESGSGFKKIRSGDVPNIRCKTAPIFRNFRAEKSNFVQQNV